MSFWRPVLNPQILPRGLPEVAHPLSWVSDPFSADGWLLCQAQLVCRRESGTAHGQLETPPVEQTVSVRRPQTVMVR